MIKLNIALTILIIFTVYSLLISSSTAIIPSTVATLSVNLATLEAFQRKTFFANTRYWVFYSDGVDIRYKTSTDGSTWGSSTHICPGGHGQSFSIWFDGTYVHYVKGPQGIGEIKYRRGKPNPDGTISWSAPEQTAFSSRKELYVYECYICVDTEGYPWIGYRWGYDGAGRYPNCTTSSLNNGTWQTAPGFPYQLSTISTGDWICSIVPLTNRKVYAIYLPAGAVRGKLWDGTTWRDEEVITTAGIVRRFAHSVVTHNDDIHLAFLQGPPTYNILYFKRTYGIGWGDQEIIETSQTSTSYPVLSIDTTTGNPYCFWGTSDIIYYKKCINEKWDSTPTTWISEPNLIEETVTCFYQAWNAKTGVIWTQGNQSPYNIRFSYVEMSNSFVDGGEPAPHVTPGIIYFPKDFPSIQEAINAANDGDIISVAAGKYYEHILVNKSVTLIGEEGTTIDGNGTGDVISVTKDRVEISGFTIQNGYRGIFLSNSIGSTIQSNTLISHTEAAIELWYSNKTIISGNRVSNSDHAIYLLYSSCGNTISDNIVTNNSQGLPLSWNCNDNTIAGNTVTSNSFAGIVLGGNNNNTIYHNNLINNPEQVYSYNSSNTWDNGAEGNYWSDYTGKDQNGDGIGDTQLPHKGFDYHPLIEPWNTTRAFNIPWGKETHHITTLCNSTVASLNFNHTSKQISFNVTGPSGTIGFCNVTIPKQLLWANPPEAWQTEVDGTRTTSTIIENATHTSLYLTYTHSTHTIKITGTSVIQDTTPPVAKAGPNQTITEDDPLTLDASASSDNIGIINYEWDFGDRTTGTGMTTTHTYPNPGTYTVTLTVRDKAGNNATDSATITVLMRDTDNDGTPDTTDTDDDNDRMSDTWETENELKPLDAADASLDPDNDGLTNLQEYQRDTNPHLPDSDGDFWSDPIDPTPENALIPNGIIILIAIILSVTILRKRPHQTTQKRLQSKHAVNTNLSL